MELVSRTAITRHNSAEVADAINADFEAGRIASVNGYELVSRFGSPVARSWQNGSISFTVQGRGRGKTNTVYTKVGGIVQVYSA